MIFFPAQEYKPLPLYLQGWCIIASNSAITDKTHKSQFSKNNADRKLYAASPRLGKDAIERSVCTGQLTTDMHFLSCVGMEGNHYSVSLYTWKRALQQGKVNPRASASVYIVLFCSECKLRRSLMTSCIWYWMFCLAWFCASAVSVRFFAHRKQKDEKQTKWSQITNSTVLNQVSALCSVR